MENGGLGGSYVSVVIPKSHGTGPGGTGGTGGTGSAGSSGAAGAAPCTVVVQVNVEIDGGSKIGSLSAEARLVNQPNLYIVTCY